MTTNNKTLEDVMICVDNSEYMRNGDMIPDRLLAEKDAVSIVCSSVLALNPENKVGIVTLAPQPQIIQTLTSNNANIMKKLYAIKPNGEIKLITGIGISYLALKNRASKRHRMRIVVFVGSPLKEEKKKLIELAKRMKKLKVIFDIISFGDEQDLNKEKLSAFIDEMLVSHSNVSNLFSHLFIVRRDQIIANVLIDSPIINREMTSSGSESLINSDSNPELAIALKISTQHQQNEDMERALEQSALEAKTNQGSNATTSNSSDDSEDQLLQKAIQMSIEHEKAKKSSDTSSSAKTSAKNDSTIMSEEEQIRLVLHLSLLEQRSNSSEQKYNSSNSNQNQTKAKSDTITNKQNQKEKSGHKKKSNHKKNNKSNDKFKEG
jgi:26S proteasome regulatory subunit N10